MPKRRLLPLHQPLRAPAFLRGEDSLTGKSFEHRKEWVVERLAELGEVFAIDNCAFAVMSSHHHTVLRIDEEQAAALDDGALGQALQPAA